MGAIRNGINSRSLTAVRRARALELRASGLSFRQISAQMGISRTTVFDDVEAALSEWATPLADNLRELEGHRLDVAQAGIWTNVVAGNLDAIASFLKISSRRAALFGLDSATRVEVVGGVLDAFVRAQGWEVAEVVALLQAAAAGPVTPAIAAPTVEGVVVELTAEKVPVAVHDGSHAPEPPSA